MTRLIQDKVGRKVLLNRLLKRSLIILGIVILMALINLFPAADMPIGWSALGMALTALADFGIKSLKELDPVLAEKFEWIFAGVVPVIVGWLSKLLAKLGK